MSWNDVAIVFATLVGPIAAVQAQKWLERRRQEEDRKIDLFVRLMATRAARVSPEHVRALNMIDIVFYGKPSKRGPPTRSAKDADVLSAWQEYYTHLNAVPRPAPGAAEVAWRSRSEELFLNLIEKLALATNFKFDRDQLRSRHYSPEAAGTVDQAQNEVLLGASAVLSGRRSLRVSLEAAPGQPAQG